VTLMVRFVVVDRGDPVALHGPVAEPIAPDEGVFFAGPALRAAVGVRVEPFFAAGDAADVDCGFAEHLPDLGEAAVGPARDLSIGSPLKKSSSRGEILRRE
jgi:hypothetical protein